MICTQCGVENQAEAHFCGACGTKLASTFDAPPGPVTGLGKQPGVEDTAIPEPGGEVVADSPVAEPPPAEESQPPQDATSEPVPVDKPPSFSEPVPIPTHMPKPLQPPPPPVNPNMPGAGIAPPPPPPGTYAAQQPQQGYGQNQPGYGYSLPADGNTSGMGEAYPVPPEAEGWTFGSFIPWGLFSFINGNTLWGVLYWVSWFFWLPIVYIIYVGMYGKKQAWQGRRFDNMQQYVDTMKAWNTWGIVMVVFTIAAIALYFLMIVGMFMAIMSEEMANPSN